MHVYVYTLTLDHAVHNMHCPAHMCRLDTNCKIAVSVDVHEIDVDEYLCFAAHTHA